MGTFSGVQFFQFQFCFLWRLLQQAGVTQESLSGGIGVCIVVVNNFYPVRLAQFLRDEKTYYDETSHEHASWHNLSNTSIVSWSRSVFDLHIMLY